MWAHIFVGEIGSSNCDTKSKSIYACDVNALVKYIHTIKENVGTITKLPNNLNLGVVG